MKYYIIWKDKKYVRNKDNLKWANYKAQPNDICEVTEWSGDKVGGMPFRFKDKNWDSYKYPNNTITGWVLSGNSLGHYVLVSEDELLDNALAKCLLI